MPVFDRLARGMGWGGVGKGEDRGRESVAVYACCVKWKWNTCTGTTTGTFGSIQHQHKQVSKQVTNLTTSKDTSLIKTLPNCTPFYKLKCEKNHLKCVKCSRPVKKVVNLTLKQNATSSLYLFCFSMATA